MVLFFDGVSLISMGISGTILLAIFCGDIPLHRPVMILVSFNTCCAIDQLPIRSV